LFYGESSLGQISVRAHVGEGCLVTAQTEIGSLLLRTLKTENRDKENLRVITYRINQYICWHNALYSMFEHTNTCKIYPK